MKGVLWAMTDMELQARLPKVLSTEVINEITELYRDADYLYGRCVYGCECLDGYYAARKNMDQEAGRKLAEARELHYSGLVTVLTALCGEAMNSVSVMYDGPEYQEGGVMTVMDRTTELSPSLALAMKSRGEETGPADVTGEGFEGPAGEMAKRAVGVSAVVDRHKSLDPETMLDGEHLDETYMVVRGMLQSACDIMRYVVHVASGDDLPPVPKPDEAGAALLVGPIAAGMKRIADKL